MGRKVIKLADGKLKEIELLELIFGFKTGVIRTDSSGAQWVGVVPVDFDVSSGLCVSAQNTLGSGEQMDLRIYVNGSQPSPWMRFRFNDSSGLDEVLTVSSGGFPVSLTAGDRIDIRPVYSGSGSGTKLRDIAFYLAGEPT